MTLSCSRPEGFIASGPAAPAARPAPRGAFTLVELLVVIALMVLLIAMGVRAFSTLGKGLPMREAVNEVTDALNSARQMAITTNANTRFVVITDPAQAFRYSSYGIMRDTFITTATGSGFVYLPAAPFQTLPAGVYFKADPTVDDGSKYITPSNPADPVPTQFQLRNQTIAYNGYRVVEFTSTGNTITSNEQNLFVLGKGFAPGSLLSDDASPDKTTIFVGASTGRVKLQNK